MSRPNFDFFSWSVGRRFVCYSLTFAAMLGAAAVSRHYLSPVENFAITPAPQTICMIHNLDAVRKDLSYTAPECLPR